VREEEEGARPRWQNAVEITRVAKYDEEEASVLKRALEAARRAAEASDEALDIVIVHSLAGGTGSGLGSRVVEALRSEMFRRNFILSSAVAPDIGGDTILQSYNAALTLEKLTEHCDGVALFRNGPLIDGLGKGAAPAFGGGGGARGRRGPRVGLEDVNSYVAAGLLGSLLPVRGVSAPMCPTRLQNLLAQVAPHSKCKLFDVSMASLSMAHAPLGTQASTWTDLSRKLAPVLNAHSSDREYPTSAATAVTAWGLDVDAMPDHPDPRAPPSHQPTDTREKEALWTGAVLGSVMRHSGLRHLDWAAEQVVAETSPNSPACVSHELGGGGAVGPRGRGAAAPRNCLEGRHQTLTVASNRLDVADFVRSVHARGTELVGVGAYVHWYEKYGVERQNIEGAMDSLADIVDDYYSAHGRGSPFGAG